MTQIRHILSKSASSKIGSNSFSFATTRTLPRPRARRGGSKSFVHMGIFDSSSNDDDDSSATGSCRSPARSDKRAKAKADDDDDDAPDSQSCWPELSMLLVRRLMRLGDLLTGDEEKATHTKLHERWKSLAALGRGEEPPGSLRSLSADIHKLERKAGQVPAHHCPPAARLPMTTPRHAPPSASASLPDVGSRVKVRFQLTDGPSWFAGRLTRVTAAPTPRAARKLGPVYCECDIEYDDGDRETCRIPDDDIVLLARRRGSTAVDGSDDGSDGGSDKSDEHSEHGGSDDSANYEGGDEYGAVGRGFCADDCDSSDDETYSDPDDETYIDSQWRDSRTVSKRSRSADQRNIKHRRLS